MATRSTLRLVDHRPLEDDELPNPLEVEIPSTEIAPGVHLDEDGTLLTHHADGGLTFDFNPDLSEPEKDQSNFYRNLANSLDDSRLRELGNQLLDGINRDEDSRKEWLSTRARGITLLGLHLEEPRGDVGTSGAPLEGMSTVRHPLLLEATIRFQATARGELLPAEGPVKVRNDSPSPPPMPPAPPPMMPPPMPMGGGPMGPPPGGGPVGPSPPSAPSPLGGVPPMNPLAASAPGMPLQQGPGVGGGAASPSPGMPLPPPSMLPPLPPGSMAAMLGQMQFPNMQAKDDLADALEKDFNHYLTVTATEYVPDTDRMLFYVGFGGDGFKKVYNCPLRRRPVSESVDAEDLIVSNAAVDLRNCGRVTHKIRMRKSILKRMQILGVYRDVNLSPPSPQAPDAVEQQKQRIQGQRQGYEKPEDRDYTIYETYCELDLDEFAPRHLKRKGLPLPYRVTIEKESRQILSIIRNWKEDDREALPKQFFVQFPFIRGIGFYGLGFIHVLGNTTSTLTAAWREMLDAGMFSNFPGFLIARSASRQLTNQLRCPPGGGVPIDLGAMQSIRDIAMPLPYKEVGPSFAGFIQAVDERGQRLGQTADMNIGEGKQEVPVGTTLALIEQATKILDSVHKRLHWAQNEEFSLLAERFREDPEAFWRHNKKPARPWEKEQFLKALDDYHLVPVADPNNPTSLHRMAKATAVEGLASKYPMLIDPKAALERVFRIAGIDSEGLFRPAPLPPPPDPRMEAIKQKSQTQAQAVQQRAQEAMGKLQLELASLGDKAKDRESRERIEQMKILLERVRLQEEAIIHRQQAGAELYANQQQSNMELATDAASRVQDMQMGAREHVYDMAQEQQAHSQRMQREREMHDLKKQHQAELHQQKLEHARALAAVQRSKASKTKVGSND